MVEAVFPRPSFYGASTCQGSPFFVYSCLFLSSFFVLLFLNGLLLTFLSLSLRGVLLANPSSNFHVTKSKNNLYLLWFMSDSCPFAKWCISFIFTLQRYDNFSIYARKTTIIFQKNELFYVYFLQWEKTPLFTRCTYARTITITTDPKDTIHTKQHPEHTQ